MKAPTWEAGGGRRPSPGSGSSSSDRVLVSPGQSSSVDSRSPVQIHHYTAVEEEDGEDEGSGWYFGD